MMSTLRKGMVKFVSEHRIEDLQPTQTKPVPVEHPKMPIQYFEQKAWVKLFQTRFCKCKYHWGLRKVFVNEKGSCICQICSSKYGHLCDQRHAHSFFLF